MSQLPSPIGFPPQQQQAFASPAREIQRIEQRQLPDGRLIEFVYVLRTFATPERTYQTVELTRSPQLDCSCAALSLADVFCCVGCAALICTRHAATCCRCGRTHCTACLVGIVHGNSRAIVCRDCARSLNSPGILKACRAFNQWLWE